MEETATNIEVGESVMKNNVCTLLCTKVCGCLCKHPSDSCKLACVFICARRGVNSNGVRQKSRRKG